MTLQEILNDKVVVEYNRLVVQLSLTKEAVLSSPFQIPII